MPEKIEEKCLQKQKSRRGRPPGSKNKNTLQKKASAKKETKKSISKIKLDKAPQPADKLAPFRKKRVKPITIKEAAAAQAKLDADAKAESENEELNNHILFKAAKWIVRNMHPSEMQFYKSDSRKRNMPLLNCMVSDMLGFFNVRDADLHKYIKTNKFIVNYSNSHGLHK
jgi:hypothetical protein